MLKCCVISSPVVWTLVGLTPAVGVLLHCFERLGVRGLLLQLHCGGAGLGGGREAAHRGQGGGPVRVQTFKLQLSLGQIHLPPVHLLLQLVQVRLGRNHSVSLHRQH